MDNKRNWLYQLGRGSGTISKAKDIGSMKRLGITHRLSLPATRSSTICLKSERGLLRSWTE